MTSSLAQPPVLTTAVRDHLLLLATCAPSVHNTQPWRFAPTHDGFVLSADRERALAVIDPYGRQLALSCGAASHCLEVAARGMGLDVETELLTGGPDEIARLHLRPGSSPSPEQVELAAAVLTRHSDRGRYADEPLPNDLLETLRLAVEAEHGSLRAVRDDEHAEVDVLVAWAEQELRATDGYADELARWVWHDGEQPDRPDGVPEAAVEHGAARAESLAGRQFRGEDPARPGPAEPPPPEHPHVLLLTTVGDSALDWVRAGRALSTLLLHATVAGQSAQVIGQVTDVAGPRQALQSLLGTGGRPQVLLRLGIGTRGVATTRRNVRTFRASAGTFGPAAAPLLPPT